MELALLPATTTAWLLDESSAEEIDLLDLLDLLDEKGLVPETLVALAERITAALKVINDIVALDEHIPIFIFLEQVLFLLVEGV